MRDWRSFFRRLTSLRRRRPFAAGDDPPRPQRRSRKRERRGAVFAASSFLAACATTTALDDFDNSHLIEGPDKTLAFVGRKIEVAQLIDGEDDPDVIVLDLGFAARYEILELVHGAYDENTIDFEAYDHYGFPRFAERDVAMLYLREYDGRLYHWKYQWDPVHLTKDGRYAFCGDPYFDLDEEEREAAGARPLQPIEFQPPVAFRLSEETAKRCRYGCTKKERSERADEVKAFYAPPAFEVRGDRAICRMGVYPDELFRIKSETLFLPGRRRDICEKELRLSEFYAYDSEEWKAVAACMDDLKMKGTP